VLTLINLGRFTSGSFEHNIDLYISISLQIYVVIFLSYYLPKPIIKITFIQKRIKIYKLFKCYDIDNIKSFDIKRKSAYIKFKILYEDKILKGITPYYEYDHKKLIELLKENNINYTFAYV